MRQALSRQIVAALSVAGPLRAPIENRYRSELSRAEWKEALGWLDEAGLTLIYWKRLRDMGAEEMVPPEVRSCLARNLGDHRLRITEMLSEFDVINSVFEAAGITYAVLKGFALIPNYCPDVFLRTAYDYDYLVAPESVSRAESCFTAAGFLRKQSSVNHPIVYFHRTRQPRSPLGRDELYKSTFPRTIELHHLFWDPEMLRIPLALPFDPLCSRELRRISALAGSQDGPQIPFFALSETDELIFQMLHVFRHVLHNWCRLCSLLDIACFLQRRAGDSAFWNRFFARIDQSHSLSDIVGLVALLAARVFGAPIPALMSAHSIETLRPSLALWVERYGPESALCNFSDNKFSLFLHREFIQDDATWREIRRSSLFPIHLPNHAAQTGISTRRARIAGAWKQGLYVSQRLTHHVLTMLRYALEAPRWHRARSRYR